jgi:D-proline reductase (dithiol) PrdB
MGVDSFRFTGRALGESLKNWPYVDTSGEEIPWTNRQKPVSDSTVALVSSAGLRHKDDLPFDMDRERSEPLWGDPSFRELPRGISQQDICAEHLHYETSHALEDFNCVMPLAALEEMLAEGRIGGITDHHLTFMGYQPKAGTLVRETAPRIAERLQEMGADLVILSPG